VTAVRTLVSQAVDSIGTNPLRVVETIHDHGRANAGYPAGDIVAEIFVLHRQELLDEVARQTWTEPIPADELRQLLVTRGLWAQNREEREASEERARLAELEERRRAVRESADHPEHQRRQLLRFDPLTRETEGKLRGGRRQGERMINLTCPVCRRRDAWFLIAPDRATWARCNHANTCGWAGPIWDLGA